MPRKPSPIKPSLTFVSEGLPPKAMFGASAIPAPAMLAVL